METTKNKLTENELLFFNKLSQYLETPLYYFGSIQRFDYLRGKSDIDVDIFTDNESSTITKLQHFLHIKKSNIKKFIWRLNSNNKLVYGHKIMYKMPEHGFNCEISIYNEKVKDEILKEHISKMRIPFFITYTLIFLKMLYYNFNIIDKQTFRYLKRKLLTIGIGLPDDDFVVIDTK